MNLSGSIQLYWLYCTKCYRTDHFLNTSIIPFNDFGNDVLFSKIEKITFNFLFNILYLDRFNFIGFIVQSALLFVIEHTISSILSRVSADFNSVIPFSRRCKVDGFLGGGGWMAPSMPFLARAYRVT